MDKNILIAEYRKFYKMAESIVNDKHREESKILAVTQQLILLKYLRDMVQWVGKP